MRVKSPYQLNHDPITFLNLITDLFYFNSTLTY